ncbi:hypothetical protein JXM83_02175 [Candidatus Woesearchaeota archaeon]|nr:hypothetical protein [Candidatus Woesearchaeota archaeon]
MNIERLFNENYQAKQLNYYLKQGTIKKISKNLELANSHFNKSLHNIKFFKLTKSRTEFKDWLIVILYYALYHSALALITLKEFSSKNHHATLLILIKEYKLTKAEVKTINNLTISKEDAQLYSNLKQERHNASYNTNILFSNEMILDYEEKVLEFLNTTKEKLLNFNQ